MTELPNPAPVLDLIQAFRQSKTMFTAVSLGIFDRLAEGSADCITLARHVGADADALQRLLDACVGLGLLEKVNSAYRNSPLATTYLTHSSPYTLSGYILYSNCALYPMFANLEAAICEGTNRWKQTFGGEVSIFEHFFRTPESRQDFLSGMNGYGQLSSPAVVAAFDLGRFRKLVDLGAERVTWCCTPASVTRSFKAPCLIFPVRLPLAASMWRAHLTPAASS